MLLHPVAGLVVLLVLLFVMFQAVFAWARPLMDLIQDGFAWLGTLVEASPLPDLLKSFFTDGIISGVGSVIVFLPQIVILFFFILVLEDLGYMARAAFLMDRIMGGAGLHGRAFIPLLSSFACAIPGIMSTRVIDDKRDRLTTILVAPLMTCSARIPVYTLIISAFIPDRDVWGFVGLQGLVMFGLYASGIASALGVAFIIKRVFWRGEPGEPFMMELPDYKLPQDQESGDGVWTRAKIFLKRAGTTILSMMVLIWFLASFPRPPAGATEPAINYSLAAMLGSLLQPLIAPIGFNWQMAVALIPGMAAREVAVGALGTVYAIDGGRGCGRQDRPGDRRPMVPRHRPGLARLVRLRAAMRLDPRRDPPRDRQLEMDVGHFRLHAGPGLRRSAHHQPGCPRAGRGLIFFPSGQPPPALLGPRSRSRKDAQL